MGEPVMREILAILPAFFIVFMVFGLSFVWFVQNINNAYVFIAVLITGIMLASGSVFYLCYRFDSALNKWENRK
jgi:cytochrome c biogenesis protein CcdA